LKWCPDRNRDLPEAALLITFKHLASDPPVARAILVIDMLEQGLDATTQEALIASLRRR
jgi:hypothetical protein